MTRVGLADTLAYRITAPNVAQRGVRRAASTRVGSRLLARHLPAMDRTVARLSRGRTTAIELLAGLPIIELTTTGRRSGARRHTQLVAIPHQESLALLGTNFGGPSTPTWACPRSAPRRSARTSRLARWCWRVLGKVRS